MSDLPGRWSFAWRVGGITFIVLSGAAALAGWVLILFDDQYEASSVAERMVIGVLGGAFGALLLAPVTAVIGVIVGVIASIYRRSRAANQTGSVSRSPSRPGQT